MTVKLIAFAAFLEYIFLKPYILPTDPDGDGDGTDFIGYCLVMSIFALIGDANLKGLPEQGRRTVLLNGLLGGCLGYAVLLFHLKKDDRQMHHLLISNGMVLAGVLCGAWTERKKKRPGWR